MLGWFMFGWVYGSDEPQLVGQMQRLGGIEMDGECLVEIMGAHESWQDGLTASIEVVQRRLTGRMN